MQVTRENLTHALWGFLFLAVALIFIRVALSEIEGVASIRLTVTPDAGHAMLEWSVHEGNAAAIDASGYTWQYRQLDLGADTLACGAVRDPGPTPRTPWQSMSPAGDGRALHFRVDGLTTSVVYRFCVRGTADDSSPWIYSPDIVVAVPSVSPARVRTIEQRLRRLESGVVIPCAGLPGELLGTLRFDVGYSTLPPSNADLAAENSMAWIEIRDKLAKRSGGHVVLAGYASADYPASHNLDLSERRVETVLEELQHTVGGQWQFETVSAGEEHDRVRSRREVPADRRVEVHWCETGG